MTAPLFCLYYTIGCKIKFFREKAFHLFAVTHRSFDFAQDDKGQAVDNGGMPTVSLAKSALTTDYRPLCPQPWHLLVCSSTKHAQITNH